MKIEVISKKPLRAYGWAWFGKIYFNDKESETFRIYEANWNIRGYQKQWQEGLERIKTHDKSCLVTSFYTDRKSDASIWMYELFNVDKKIYIQQRLLTPEFVAEDNLPPLTLFNSKNCYSYIGERSKDVLEWIVTIE